MRFEVQTTSGQIVRPAAFSPWLPRKSLHGKALSLEQRLTKLASFALHRQNEKQLAPMRGSKYVQSDPELVYRDALKCLKAGKLVLFTGCPCQVAAMKNIAGKKYSDLLYTIDLLCHGVPSQAILQRYLEETFPGKQAVDVRFRDKSHGWIATYIDVDFLMGLPTTVQTAEMTLMNGFSNTILHYVPAVTTANSARSLVRVI